MQQGFESPTGGHYAAIMKIVHHWALEGYVAKYPSVFLGLQLCFVRNDQYGCSGIFCMSQAALLLRW